MNDLMNNPNAWYSYVDFAAWTKRKFDAIQTDYEKVYFVRELSDALFHLKSIKTHMVSESSQHKKLSELCQEHYFSRKNSARFIFKVLSKRNISTNRLALLVKSRNRVHFVSKDENQKLKQFQKPSSPYKTWREQYRAAGINLVPWTPLKRGPKTK